MTDKNIRTCECCGKPRPYPTTPGRWRYRMYNWKHWLNVTVKDDDPEGLTITPDGESEPIWWPNNAQWEKVED